uniref:Uncharacterized protein n=1 Tax=Oryza brachyantha TaxID=4533 RepID=J3MKT3_ORYBR
MKKAGSSQGGVGPSLLGSRRPYPPEWRQLGGGQQSWQRQPGADSGAVVGSGETMNFVKNGVGSCTVTNGFMASVTATPATRD